MLKYILHLEFSREQINMKNILRASPFLSVSTSVGERRECPSLAYRGFVYMFYYLAQKHFLSFSYYISHNQFVETISGREGSMLLLTTNPVN
jgi:hypothetical protein